VQASAIDVLDVSGADYDDAFTINVPGDIGGTGTTVTVLMYDGSGGLGTPPANTIHFNGRGSGNDPRDALILAINGTADSAKAVFGNGSDTLVGANVAGVGIKGLTVAVGTATNPLTLTAAGGNGGNGVEVIQTVGSNIVDTSKLGQASAADALSAGGFSYNDAFTVNVPGAVGGTGTTVTIVAYDGASGLGTPAANTIRFNGRGSGTDPRDALLLAINGTADSTKAVFGSGSDTLVGANVAGVGIKGLTAAVGSTDSLADLTASYSGASGAAIEVLDTVGTTIVDASTLTSNKLSASNLHSGANDSIQTAKRLFEPGLNFGGSKGTTYEGSTIGRTNTSVGDKDLIRDSAA
jgi:hypothetical protein